jgi:hypothetical protein
MACSQLLEFELQIIQEGEIRSRVLKNLLDSILFVILAKNTRIRYTMTNNLG